MTTINITLVPDTWTLVVADIVTNCSTFTLEYFIGDSAPTDIEKSHIMVFRDQLDMSSFGGRAWFKSASSAVLATTTNIPEVISNVTVSNGPSSVVQHIEDVTPQTISNYYSFSLASGDFMNFSRSSNGQQFTEISMNPLSIGDEQTIVEYKTPFEFPCYSEIEASLSQRVKGQYSVMEITDKDSSYVDAPVEYTLTSVSQSTTTLTVGIDSAFDGYLGSWVDIYGLADNRFNYTNLCVNSISSDKKTLTFTTSNEAALPSLTATPASIVGKLKRQAKLLQAANALGMRFSGSSATACVYLSRFAGGSIKESGVLGGIKTVTCGTTTPTFTSGSMGNVEIKAPNRYRIEAEPEIMVFGDRVSDAVGNLSIRNTFTAVKPIGNNQYYVRFRAVTPKSISRPIAKIVSAVKSGTTLATIVTDAPHGLNTTSYVTIKGVRSQTSTAFPRMTVPTIVTSIIDDVTFTIDIGTAGTATSFGGAVILCNGSVDQQGDIGGGAIDTVSRDASGLINIIGTASWIGLNVGEYVNIYGVRTVTSDLGIDGAYKVHNISTNTLILEPVKNLDGSIVVDGSGSSVTPTGNIINSAIAGGCVILRTTLRSHDIVLATYSQAQMKIMGQGSYRTDMALPVVHLGNINTVEATLISPSVGTLTTAASTNATSLKTTAGNIYALTVSNTSASAIYLKIYNKATAPTVGTDVPLMIIPIQANSFYTVEFGRVGIRFATGIAYAVTGASATTDTTVITAGSLLTVSYI